MMENRINAIAGYLGFNTVKRVWDERDDDWQLLLSGAEYPRTEGKGIHITIERKTERLHVSQIYPPTVNGWRWERPRDMSRPSISVSMKKTDEQIAADIQRRLMPAVNEQWLQYMKDKDNHVAYIEKHQALVAEVCATLRMVPPSSDDYGGNETITRGITTLYMARQSRDANGARIDSPIYCVKISGQIVTFEYSSNDTAQALAVLNFIQNASKVTRDE